MKEMFENEDEFIKSILKSKNITIEPKKGKFGYYIGSHSFEKKIERKFNRWEGITKKHPHMRRRVKERDSEFKPPNLIIETFKDYYNVHHFEDFLNERSYNVTRKIDILIRLLKDESGLTYRDISRYLGLRYNSLTNRYRRTKRSNIPQALFKDITRGEK